MSSGYIYILSNPSMVGMLKIGVTTGNPKDRAASMGMNTGIPLPFNIEWSKKVRSIYEVESEMHERLSASRVSKVREFFSATLDEVLEVYVDIMDERTDIVAGQYSCSQ